MGFLSFLGFYSKQKVNDIAKDVTSTIVSIDPEGASEAQLNMMLEKLSDISKNVAKYRRAYQKDLAETQEWKDKFNQTISALEVLEQDLATAETSKAVQIGDAIDSLLDEVEKIEVEISREEAEDIEAKEILDTFEKAEKDLAEKIKSARANLRKMTQQIEQAKVKKEMAEERLEARKEAQGFGNSLDSLTIANDYMEKELNKLQDEENALKSQAELLKDKENPHSDLVADALARANGESRNSSRAERLAKLRAKR